MAGKAVQSAGNAGPRDFSQQVRAHFASPAPMLAFTARIYLADEEAGKISAGDVAAALAALLAREGVEPRVDVSEASGVEDVPVRGERL